MGGDLVFNHSVLTKHENALMQKKIFALTPVYEWMTSTILFIGC